MTWLHALVRARFPNASVYRLEGGDRWRVELDIDDRDLADAKINPEPFVRRVFKNLTPVQKRPRRLHYGKKH